MEQISFGIAFAAGILSFLSPCVLPLVPGYISFLSGMSLEDIRSGKDRKRISSNALAASVFFVLGFSLVFMAFGASATYIGRMLSEHMAVLSRIAGIIIILLGFHLTGLLKVRWLNYQKHIDVSSSAVGLFKAFLVGLAFAFGWSPCVGPILAGILAIAATQKTLLKGIALLGTYSLGLGIPFIVTGLAIGVFMRFFERYRGFIRAGEIVAGVLLIGIGVLIFTNNLEILLRFVPESFYEFSK